jgi:hypothetical protein
VALDVDTVDPFAIIDRIRQDVRTSDQLRSLSIPAEAVKNLMRLRELDSRIRVDVRSDEGHVTFINNIEVRTPYSDAKVANRVGGISGSVGCRKWAPCSTGIPGGRYRSRGRFATPADFPLHEGTPYRGLHVRRWGLGLSIVQGPFSVAPCSGTTSRGVCARAQTDDMYKRWATDLDDMLRPSRGRLPSIRKNLFTAVFVLDAASDGAMAVADTFAYFLQNQVRLRSAYSDGKVCESDCVWAWATGTGP